MSRVVNRKFERKADIGIDLGNTNSYAWVSVGGRMRCVVAPDGGYHFPSYVYYRKDGSITVGSAAKRLFGSKIQSVVTNAMELIPHSDIFWIVDSSRTSSHAISGKKEFMSNGSVASSLGC